LINSPIAFYQQQLLELCTSFWLKTV